MTLVLTNKLFKSPSGLFFKCCGIVRAMPITIDKIEVFIDFHIFAILEFELLIGHPLNNLFQEKPSYGGLDEKLGTTTSAIPIPYPKSPMAKQHPNHEPFKEVKFISPFISHSCETEHPTPSLDLKQCPSGQPTIVLKNDRDSMLFPHDILLTKENSYAMDLSKAPTLETEEHESFSFETPHVSCSHLESLEFVVLSAACRYEEDNHPSLLISKLFRRMVVDVFVCHKFCKSHSSIVVLTL